MVQKKFVSFVIIFVLCCNLLACKKGEENVSLGDDFQLGYDSQTYFTDHRNIAKTEDGYYFNYSSTYLFYMDAKTGECTKVCNKPECSHGVNEDCNADMTSFTEYVWYYDDALYLIGTNESDTSEYWLYKQDLDGTNREKVTYLFTIGEQGLTLTADIHRGYLYYVIANDNVNDSSERIMYRIKLEKNAKSEEFASISGYGSGFMRINGYGDYIYFEEVQYGDADGNDETVALCRYDLSNKKCEEIDSGTIYDYVIVDNKVYYYDSEVINVYNMEDQTTTEFYEPNEEACINFKFDGTYFYFDNYLDIFLADMDMSERTIQIVDLDGKLVKTLSVPNKGICEYGDENYLFLYRGMAGDEVDNNEIVSIYDKSQILTDEDEWTSFSEKIYATAEG